MRTFDLIPALMFLALAMPAVAQENAAPEGDKNPHAFATAPEGKTLPENVARARLVYGAAVGNGFQYDKDGNKKDAMVDVAVSGGAFIAEYGLSDKMSLQLRQDFISSQEISLNSANFKSSDEFASYKQQGYASNSNLTALGTATGTTITDRDSFLTAATIEVASKAVAAGKCGTVSGASAEALVASCVANIRAGQAATGAFASDVLGDVGPGQTLGERLAAAAAATDAAVEDGVLEAAKASSESTGGEGLGDTTVGVLYEVMNDGPLAISVGSGIRYPTGNRDRAANERVTGRGLTEFGVRTDVDYLPIDSVRLSWENQAEVMVAAGKYNVAGEAVTVKRKGVRNKGFFIVKPSLAGLSPSLSFIGTKLGMSYDYDSEEMMKVGSMSEESTGDRSSENKLYAGLAANFLEFSVPAQLEFEYYKSQSGKNVAVATDSWDVQLKAFAKF